MIKLLQEWDQKEYENDIRYIPTHFPNYLLSDHAPEVRLLQVKTFIVHRDFYRPLSIFKFSSPSGPVTGVCTKHLE